MIDTIRDNLDRIERDHSVSILFAIESGSRAWGFPSTDSDYDVRFVYARPVNWYLSIAPKRDVIEIPVGPVLDINGWDIQKALHLLRKSNNSILEWLSSPIRYRYDDSLVAPIIGAAKLGFRKFSAAKHYLSMAKSNIAKTHGTSVRMKSYLYAVRPLLCCRWVIVEDSQPPMLFCDLVDHFLGSSAVGTEICKLVALKESQRESDAVPENPVLNEFVVSEFDKLSSMLPNEVAPPDVEPFNVTFRQIITAAEERHRTK